MRNYEKYEVDKVEYDRIRLIKSDSNCAFKERISGSRRSLYVKDVLIASEVSSDGVLDIGELSNSQFVSFLGTFKKNFYSQMLSCPALFDLKVDFKGVSRSKNIELWNSLPINSYFYNVDLSSAYWQIANRLGYISKKLFEAYMNVDSYKQVKRYCISFLARKSKTVFQMSSGNDWVIDCDISIFQKVYDNIRNELYICVNKSLDGVCECLEWNIDGVMVTGKDLNVVRDNFNAMGLIFKVVECRKVGDRVYEYKGLKRNFKNK